MPSTCNKDIVSELLDILKQWEDDQSSNSTKDPTPHLIKLCELFEKENINFLKKDPDPFDDRHPVTSEPDCALGQILRALFKKEAFVNKLVGSYLRENYFTNLGLSKDSTELNTTACRLLIGILYGLDIPEVFRDSETTVTHLFSWAEKAKEPLRTYATGLLAAAMDITDIATSFKDHNAHLVPLMFRRLWHLKDKGGGLNEVVHETSVIKSDISERPFASLQENNERNLEIEVNLALRDHKNDNNVACMNHKRQLSESKEDKEVNTRKRRKTGDACIEDSHITEGANSRTSNEQKPVQSHTSPKPTEDCLDIFMSDCSNSSWAEMSGYILGTYQIYPLTRETQQLFILRYLRPVAEYQESVGHASEHNALELVLYYIKVKKLGSSRLAFDGLRLLGSLLFHKKFCLEFIQMGGIPKLLQVPRPSLPADGVALCLWYLTYSEEAIEKICLLPDQILTEVIRYALWLVECSHQSSRTHAVMFFDMAFRFRAILERFDEQDGIRKMLNMLSTLSLFQDPFEPDAVESMNEAMMWQTIKQVCLAIKSYFEAHLALKVQHLQRASAARENAFYQQSTPSYKPLNVTEESTSRNVEYLLEHFPFRARWRPVEQFLQLKGLEMFLQLMALILNDTINLKIETAVSALDALYICSVVPLVQAALCEKLTIPAGEDLLQTLSPLEVPGYGILVACISENNQNLSSPEVQIAALRVLINCVCAPIQRPGGTSSKTSTTGMPKTSTSLTPGSSKKKHVSFSSEDILNKSFECIRTSNGIMYLLHLLHKKVPITDADYIRSLACQALAGLARSDAARQIMSKLPLFTSGELQLLVREPILQDKRAEHMKFLNHAMKFIKLVFGKEKQEGVEISLHRIHKDSVVAQTKITYNKAQLLQLIQSYLANEGYESVAEALQAAAKLPPLPHSNSQIMRNISTPPPRQGWQLNSSSSQSFSSASSCTKNVSSPLCCNNSLMSSPSGPLQIKLTRYKKPDVNRCCCVTCSVNSTPVSLTKDVISNVSSPQPNFLPPSSGASSFGRGFESTITLEKIVTEYLANQHALCKNPIVTCPTFSLFQPHRCPEPKSARCMSVNYATRHVKREYQLSHFNRSHQTLNRKFIYSKFRPSTVFRPSDDEVFLCCQFMADDQYVIAGNSRGEVRMFNKNDSSLYDVNTCQLISEFTPTLSNHYKLNQAALDPFDELVLTDGALFDVKSGKQLHKFDKINPIINGIFHRNGLEIISSSEIWDLRTFHLLKTVSALNLCQTTFNHTNDVIFAITVGEMDEIQDNAYETSFKTVDATLYSSIATVDVRRIVSSLAINKKDTQLAIVEADSDSDNFLESAVVRLYDIGMIRQEDDEIIDDDDEDDDDDDDDEDDDEIGSDDSDESDNERNSNNDNDENASGWEFSSPAPASVSEESDSDSVLFELIDGGNSNYWQEGEGGEGDDADYETVEEEEVDEESVEDNGPAETRSSENN